MKTITILVFFAIIPSLLCSQVKIGDNQNQISSSALLELESSNKGMILPRVSLLKLTDPGPLANHEQGMIVYNINMAGEFPNQISPGYYINNGLKWIRIMDAEKNGPSIGDVKQSFSTIDHDGWYFLNGRALSTLSPNVKLAAESLFSGNALPNANGKFLYTSSNTNQTGGSYSFTIQQRNLPLISHDLETSLEGNHSHSTSPVSPLTTIEGAHNHSFSPASNNSVFDVQGHPVDNNHNSFRTSDKGGNYINNFIVADAGGHQHRIEIGGFTTTEEPKHRHSIAPFDNGGQDFPIDFIPRYLTVGTFIYLGE